MVQGYAPSVRCEIVGVSWCAAVILPAFHQRDGSGFPQATHFARGQPDRRRGLFFGGAVL